MSVKKNLTGELRGAISAVCLCIMMEEVGLHNLN